MPRLDDSKGNLTFYILHLALGKDFRPAALVALFNDRFEKAVGRSGLDANISTTRMYYKLRKKVEHSPSFRVRY